MNIGGWFNFVPTFLAAVGGSNSAGHASENPAAVSASQIDFLVQRIVEGGVALLCLGIAICLYRLWRGPHLADRVLAADAMALHVVALVILLAVKYRTMMFFDAALIVAIIGFATALAFAQYIGGEAKKKQTEQSSTP